MTKRKKPKKKNKPTAKSIKKARKTLSYRVPSNYAFWIWTIKSPKQLQDFIDRGSDRQKDCIKRTLNYLKKIDLEEFKKLGGEKWLEKLKIY